MRNWVKCVEKLNEIYQKEISKEQYVIDVSKDRNREILEDTLTIKLQESENLSDKINKSSNDEYTLLKNKLEVVFESVTDNGFFSTLIAALDSNNSAGKQKLLFNKSIIVNYINPVYANLTLSGGEGKMAIDNIYSSNTFLESNKGYSVPDLDRIESATSTQYNNLKTNHTKVNIKVLTIENEIKKLSLLETELVGVEISFDGDKITTMSQVNEYITNSLINPLKMQKNA